MERRQFIKASCGFCLLAAAGTVLPSFLVHAASRPKVFKTELTENNQVIVPVTLFEETNVQVIRVRHFDYDITLHKGEDGTYTALLMRCTHMDNQLDLTSEGFNCSLHGSTFDKNGVVTKGPAEMPLTKYQTSIDTDNIIITIPKEENKQ